MDKYRNEEEIGMEIEIHSLQETQRLAERLAQLFQNQNMVLCLRGDLGAGKTTFTKSFGRALGVKKVINSPTFNIMKLYPMEDGRIFHHIDAYRLEGVEQDLGFDELLEEGVAVVEWSDYLQDALPQDVLVMTIERKEDENRHILLEGTGSVSNQMIQELQKGDLE